MENDKEKMAEEMLMFLAKNSNTINEYFRRQKELENSGLIDKTNIKTDKRLSVSSQAETAATIFCIMIGIAMAIICCIGLLSLWKLQ